MTLYEIQKILMELYNIECDLRIDDFLIGRRRFLELCADNPHALNPHWEESLIVLKSSDGFRAAVYVDPDIIDAIKAIDITSVRLSDKNIQGICHAIEATSHFLYFISCVAHEREMSYLELELQAEIDKFALLSFCLLRDLDNPMFGHIISTLFEKYTLVKGLAPEIEERYREASRFAARYCASLEERYVYPWFSGRKLLSELRKFYSLNHWSKISHIDNG